MILIMKKIQIKGPVISDSDGKFMEFWGMQDAYTYPSKVRNVLDNANGEDITLEINSPGGIVSEGSEIYTALKQYSGHVEAHIYGDADSAASVIAMGADKVLMSPTAQMMIHKSSGGGAGHADDMQSIGRGLDQIDQSLVNVYAKKTGKSKEEIYNMLNAQTFMNAETAVKEGFADGIMEDAKKTLDEVQPAFNSAVPLPHLSTDKRDLFTEFLKSVQKATDANPATDEVDKPIQDKNNDNDDSQLLKNKLAILFAQN